MIDHSTMLLMVSIGVLIFLLALIILFHQNANATKGYELRTLERERTQLHLEEEIVKMRIAEEQALGYLQNDERIVSMVAVRKPLYVNEEHPVAMTTPPDSRY